MSVFVARYACAFADVVAQFHIDPAAVDAQLDSFLDVWDESSALREVFADPSIPTVQKIAVVGSLRTKLSLAPQVRNLLAVLIDHGRIGAIREVVVEYRAEARRRLGIHQAQVVTARELTDVDREELLAHVAKLANGRVNATFTLDPGILGGVVVRIGSTVYDGSVLGRVQRLRETLAD